MGFFSGLDDVDAKATRRPRGFIQQGEFVVEIESIVTGRKFKGKQRYHIVEATVLSAKNVVAPVAREGKEAPKLLATGDKIKWFELLEVGADQEPTQRGEFAMERIQQFYGELFGQKASDVTEAVLEKALEKGIIGVQDEKGQLTGGDKLKGTLINAVGRTSGSGYVNPVFFGMTTDEQAEFRANRSNDS